MSAAGRIATILSRLRQTAHLMVGLQDYDAYVAHRRARHPGEPVMSRGEFVAAAQEKRFSPAAGGPPRCC